MTRPRVSLGVRTAAVMIVLSIALCASPAEASGAGIIITDEMIALTLLSGSVTHFGACDLIFAVLWRPMPIWLSSLQLGVGGILTPAVTLAARDSSELAPWAIASGIWFAGHGLYNLAIYPEYARKKREKRERERLERELDEPVHFGWSLQPDARGGMLHLRVAM